MNSIPYEDARKIKTEGNLDYYEYPQSIVSERIKN